MGPSSVGFKRSTIAGNGSAESSKPEPKTQAWRASRGGSTGLVVVDQIRAVGDGDNFRLISTYAVDTPLLKELREIEKQAAQELGQWQVRVETSAVDIRAAVALTQAAADAYVEPED